ncbi:YciI family protein [Thalassomonas haliotis]|uniref:YCII-related domain-containing protein n=1 Tax=Thalassomonas haliotis TaxID=485448 RepID=A0ABY7VFC8_9GAMM|nr:YciI family protein [Thalassomonas haliotis]WDE11844.1 hypothetical protein H3N35_27265 [Thalassomonas haliotis]
MFLINMTFVKELSEVDLFTADHRDYMAKQYETGKMLFGGRKVPREGGIIVSKHDSLHDLMQVMENDPFIINKVATFDVVEFEPVMRAEQLQGLI